MWAIHWAHVPILRIKKTSADFGVKYNIFKLKTIGNDIAVGLQGGIDSSKQKTRK